MAEGGGRGLNPEAPKPEPNPLAGQVPEADQQAIERAQDRIVEAIKESGARGALEDLAGESAEPTAGQQKVEEPPTSPAAPTGQGK